MVLKKLREEKAEEDAARAVAAEEQAKLEKKKAKEALTSRYKVPSAGFNETDAAVKLAALKARQSPTGAKAGASADKAKGGKAGEVPKPGEVHSYGTKKEDEFDIQVGLFLLFLLTHTSAFCFLNTADLSRECTQFFVAILLMYPFLALRARAGGVRRKG